MAETYRVHDNDVIFYKESLEEFIRLIKRQGINNLEILSVNELIKTSDWKNHLVKNQENLDVCEFFVSTSTGHNISTNTECLELNNNKGCIVFINKSKGFQEEGYIDKYNILSLEDLKEYGEIDDGFYYRLTRTTPYTVSSEKRNTKFDEYGRRADIFDDDYIRLGTPGLSINRTGGYAYDFVTPFPEGGCEFNQNNRDIKKSLYQYFSLYRIKGIDKIIDTYDTTISNRTFLGYFSDLRLNYLKENGYLIEVNNTLQNVEKYGEFILQQFIMQQVPGQEEPISQPTNTLLVFNLDTDQCPLNQFKTLYIHDNPEDDPLAPSGVMTYVYYGIEQQAKLSGVGSNVFDEYYWIDQELTLEVNRNWYDEETEDENIGYLKQLLVPKTQENWTLNFTNSDNSIYYKQDNNYFLLDSGPYTKNTLESLNCYKKESTLINIANGRHLYVKSLGDINFYAENGSPITKVSNLNIDLTAQEVDGTFTIRLDDDRAVVRIRGFDQNGNWTGGIKLGTSSNTATDATFLRGDGWNDFLTGDFAVGGDPDNRNKADASTKADNNIHAICALGKAGSIYMYSQGSTTGIRGIKGYNPDGSAISILEIDENNNITMPNSINLTLNSLTDNSGSTGTSAQFLRGDNIWSNILNGQLHINKSTGMWKNSYSKAAIIIDKNSYTSWIAGDTKDGKITITTYPNGDNKLHFGYLANDNLDDNNTDNKFNKAMTWEGNTGYLTTDRVYNAVYNDYAEYRTTINLEPGHVVIDQDDGSLICSSIRLQPGAQIISDTFGHCMGETDNAKTPLAVSGRVLVYTYQPRENYHAGMAVCSAPNGTVDIMTREEIKEYPDCIIGIVSEIPSYDTWGSNNVKVDGRIWIKVK